MLNRTLAKKIEQEEVKFRADNEERLIAFLQENIGKLLNVEFFGLSFFENMEWNYSRKRDTIIISDREDEGGGTLEINLDNILNADMEFCQDGIFNIEFINIQGENLRMYCD